MLEKCEALRLAEIKSSGRTRPLVVECEFEETGNRELLLVKAFGLPEVDGYGLYCELLGNLLAIEFGLDTPKPSLVNLSKEFVEAVTPKLRQQNLNLRSGLSVGVEYFSQGFNPIPAFALLPIENIEKAASIYAFDLLVQNPDRLPRNPNCAFLGKKLIAYDFNLAFSFLLLIGQRTNSWEVSKTDIGINHLFYRSLKGREINWKSFVQTVKNLTEKRIRELCALIPADWGNHTDKICEHLVSASQNSQELEFELHRSLSS